jgi:hypothetical protein
VISYTIFSFYLALDMRKIYSENYITIYSVESGKPTKNMFRSFFKEFS